MVKTFSRTLSKLLFKNTSLKQTVFKNSFWLLLSNLLARVFKFFLFIYTARILGPGDYGQFSYFISILGALFSFCELGLSTILIREYQQEKQDSSVLFSTIFVFKASLILLALAASIAVYFTPVIDTYPTAFLILLAMTVLHWIKSYFWTVANAKNHMQIQGISFIIETFLTTVLGILALLFDGRLEVFCLAYLAGHFASFLFSTIALRRHWPSLSKFDSATGKRVLKLGIPFLATSFLVLMMNSTDVIMIKWLVGTIEAGYFSATHKIMHTTLAMIGFLVTVLYPLLSKHAQHPERISLLLKRATSFYFIIGFPLVCGGLLLTESFILTFLGAAYLPGLFCLQLFILTIPVSLFSTLFNTTMLSIGREQTNMKISGFILSLNAVLNVLAILTLGFAGAALATLFSRFLDAVVTHYMCRKAIGYSLISLSGLWQWGLATAAMAGILLTLKSTSLHLVATVLLSAGAYVVILFSLKEPNLHYLYNEGKDKLLTSKAS